MKKTKLTVAASLIITCGMVIAQILPPRPVPSEAPASEFSAERAIEHIRVIAQRPHPTGSEENRAVREYILNELTSLGLETETQRDGDLENVLGWIPGTHSSDALLLTAHYDSTVQSPGAMDDGSGVAALLETARALTSHPRPRNTIVFLFTDGEEGGLFGAKAFIAHHPWAKDVRIVIGLDAGGIRGPAVLSTTSPNNGWLIRQLIQAGDTIIGNSAISSLGYSSTDFGRAFKPAGYSGYAFDLYWDKRDGAEDNLDNINPASVQHHGNHALALARHFGNLEGMVDPQEPDAVYFSILQLFTINYPSSWAGAISLVVAVIFIIVLVYGLRRGILSLRGMAYGALILLASLIFASIPYLFLEYVIGYWEPKATFDWDHRLVDQPLPMSVIFLSSLALIILWHSLSRMNNKINLSDITLGALAPMGIGVCVTSIILPGISFAFTWPLLICLLERIIWFRNPTNGNSTGATLRLAISGIVVTAIVLPSILLGIFDQLLLSLASLGVLCGFLLPHIHFLLGNLPTNLT
ncbi:MAG: M20/M25/M40 family metallo-hydrolase [Chloroflexi bacterium]|nr:M20/M25/M40 family metallo-hydrolase [Chloroflexota bacterium]